MKYFIDTEFIEGFHKPLFGKRRHHIDLISIGIVAENGSSYSAISSEYKFNDASKWVQDNIITPLYTSTIPGPERQFTYVETFQKTVGKKNEQIAKEITEFIYKTSQIHNPHAISNWEEVKHLFPIEFYGYYADYDWVLLCSLFGAMVDLPKGFPMYCRDLKQMMDAGVTSILKNNFAIDMRNDSLKNKLEILKSRSGYPKQSNEHNALADAKWNKELYSFLTK